MKPSTKLEKFITAKKAETTLSRPLILNLTNEVDRVRLVSLIEENKIQQVVDDYEEQRRELFAINNVSLAFQPDFEIKFKEHYRTLQQDTPIWQQGAWVYYPWLFALVHVLPDKEFQFVRTARNRHLITKEEQEKFYNAVVGIAGMSVGNSVALAIVLQGGARHIKLADLDRLAVSNLNRIRAGVGSLGLLKTEMTARQIYEINPYAQVELFSDGLTNENIERFFAGPPKLDVMIDEIDNLAMKYRIREYARKHKLPVVMAADVADSGVVYVERYDENPNPEFFHNCLGKTSYEELKQLDKLGTGRKIAQMVGLENHTEAMLRSLTEMGKTLVSWPQLGGTAMLNGAVLALCVRRIVTGQSLINGRVLISPEQKLIPDYDSLKAREQRAAVVETFKKILGL